MNNIKVNSDDDNVNLLCPSCKAVKNAACNHNAQLLQQYGFDQNAIVFLQKGPARIEFLLHNTFLHYRSASWETGTNHAIKTKQVFNYLDEILRT